jgi:hypothetical protein
MQSSVGPLTRSSLCGRSLGAPDDCHNTTSGADRPCSSSSLRATRGEAVRRVGPAHRGIENLVSSWLARRVSRVLHPADPCHGPFPIGSVDQLPGAVPYEPHHTAAAIRRRVAGLRQAAGWIGPVTVVCGQVPSVGPDCREWSSRCVEAHSTGVRFDVARKQLDQKRKNVASHFADIAVLIVRSSSSAIAH